MTRVEWYEVRRVLRGMRRDYGTVTAERWSLGSRSRGVAWSTLGGGRIDVWAEVARNRRRCLRMMRRAMADGDACDAWRMRGGVIDNAREAIRALR